MVEIKNDTVIESFKKCGSSNTIDGTEGGFHFDHNIGCNDEMSDSFPSDSESNMYDSVYFVGFNLN